MPIIRRVGLLQRNKKAGFTLTEIAVVLTVVSSILGAIWVVWGQVDTSNKIRITIQQLQAIIHNIRSIHEEQGGVVDTGTAVLTQALDQLNAFPLEMRQNQSTPAGVIFHPWSSQTIFVPNLGSVSVDAYDGNGVVNTTGAVEPNFGIKYFDIPQNACTQLVAQISQAGLGLEQVVINGTIAGDANAATDGNPPLPIPDNTILTDCNNTGSTGISNDILWIYSVKSGGS